MPMIARAWARASSGVAASLMPPALPRLPVGTCALTTTAPIRAAAAAASSGVAASVPRGTAMPWRARSGLAACSSKFIGFTAYLPYFFQYAPKMSSSEGLFSGMVRTMRVMFMKCL
ncbi:hypothetical protein D3C83_05340 [compost metagenome]